MQAAVGWLLGWYLRFALSATRWSIVDEANAAPYMAGEPCIAAFWHERLPLMPMFWLMTQRRSAGARMHVLVSRHRDGRLIGDVMRRFSVDVVHGSSSRGGAAGLRRLSEMLARGEHVAITPDGPRGPRRRAASGVAQLAGLSGVAVLPCAAQTTRRFVLRSWDRMVVPLPFGRGVIVCGAPIAVARETWAEAVPAIATALSAAADMADRLCERGR